MKSESNVNARAGLSEDQLNILQIILNSMQMNLNNIIKPFVKELILV